jgi:hypothetical protein
MITSSVVPAPTYITQIKFKQNSLSRFVDESCGRTDGRKYKESIKIYGFCGLRFVVEMSVTFSYHVFRKALMHSWRELVDFVNDRAAMCATYFFDMYFKFVFNLHPILQNVYLKCLPKVHMHIYILTCYTSCPSRKSRK